MSHDFLLNKPILKILSKYPDIDRVLDIGAGLGSWGQIIRAGLSKKIEICAIEKYSENCERLLATGLYTHVICDDALKLMDYYSPGAFDVVLACQVIEHMGRLNGSILIDIMKDLASKLVIITTPQGYMPVSAETNPNPYEKHLSGWAEADFKKKGFKTTVLDMRPMNRSIRLVDDLRRWLFGLYDPHQIIATWEG